MRMLRNAAIAMAALVIGSTASAQDLPKKGTFTTEVQFNPFSNSFETFRIDGLQARYFFTDKDAIRLNIGFGIDNKTDNNNSSMNTKYDELTENYTITNTTDEMKTHHTSFQIALGYERHFPASKRLDFYVGGELGFQVSSYSAEENINTTTFTQNRVNNTGWSRTTTTELSSSRKIEYDNMQPATPGSAAKFSDHEFFINALAGADFYVYKGLYVGTELGISFRTGKEKNGTWTDNRTATSVQTVRYSGSYPSGFTNETITTNSYSNFSSSTGITESNATIVSSIPANTPAPTDPTYTSVAATDHDATTTKLKIYIEPAIRLGWRF